MANKMDDLVFENNDLVSVTQQQKQKA